MFSPEIPIVFSIFFESEKEMNRNIREAKRKLEELKTHPATTKEEQMFVHTLDIIVNSPFSRDLRNGRSLVRKALRRVNIHYETEKVGFIGYRFLMEAFTIWLREAPPRVKKQLDSWMTETFVGPFLDPFTVIKDQADSDGNLNLIS